MPAQKRFKTNYPGVYFIEGRGRDGNPERIYIIRYRREGRLIEEKAGRQHLDAMTPAKAAKIRAARQKTEGDLPNRERRAKEAAEKAAEEGRWTVARVWDEYRRLSPGLKGLSTYKSLYERHIGPEFGAKELKDICPLDAKRFMLRTLKARSPQLVQHALELLRRLSNFAKKQRLCPGLDFQVEMPVVDNVKTEDLDQDQLARLLAAIDRDDHPQAGPMMKLALFTGMRRGELFRLEWRDLDFQRRFITIRGPKSGKDQIIPMNDAAYGLLTAHPQRDDSPYVFPNAKGEQWINITKAVIGCPVDPCQFLNLCPHCRQGAFTGWLSTSACPCVQCGAYATRRTLRQPCEPCPVLK